MSNDPLHDRTCRLFDELEDWIDAMAEVTPDPVARGICRVRLETAVDMLAIEASGAGIQRRIAVNRRKAAAGDPDMVALPAATRH